MSSYQGGLVGATEGDLLVAVVGVAPVSVAVGLGDVGAGAAGLIAVHEVPLDVPAAVAVCDGQAGGRGKG